MRIMGLRVAALFLLICVGAGTQLFDDPAHLGMWQLYFFPLLVILTGTTRAVRLLPRQLKVGFFGLLGLLLIGLFVSRVSFDSRTGNASEGAADVEVAFLSDDPFGGLARAITAEVVRRSPAPFAMRTVEKRFLNATEARNYLNSNKNVKTLIWGTRERLILEQGLTPASKIRLGIYTVGPLTEVKLIRDIPRFVLPIDSDFHSFHYLARLLSGIVFLESDEITALSRIRSAAFLRGLWPTQSHLAYAFWRSGTDFLQVSLSSEVGRSAYADCALASLRVAWRMLSQKDNPYLAAAILNNYGVALTAKGILEVAPAQLRLAVAALRRGKKLARTMRFEHINLNSKEDRMFFGGTISQNLRIVNDYAIWNNLPSIRRTKSKKNHG